MENKVMELLQGHDLRKTKVRSQVLKIFLDSGEQALSHSDIEQNFDKLDRVTLYRTLRTFEEKGLIHQALDGSGSSKYALCSNDCSTHSHKDEHAHFHCNQCGKTICLDAVPTPKVNTPSGFQIEDAYLVLTGKCDQCV